jgi:hypothetical protein
MEEVVKDGDEHDSNARNSRVLNISTCLMMLGSGQSSESTYHPPWLDSQAHFLYTQGISAYGIDYIADVTCMCSSDKRRQYDEARMRIRHKLDLIMVQHLINYHSNDNVGKDKDGVYNPLCLAVGYINKDKNVMKPCLTSALLPATTFNPQDIITIGSTLGQEELKAAAAWDKIFTAAQMLYHTGAWKKQECITKYVTKKESKYITPEIIMRILVKELGFADEKAEVERFVLFGTNAQSSVLQSM